MESLACFPVFPPLLLSIPLLTVVSYLVINYLIYSRRVAQWKKSNIPFLRPSFLIGHNYFFNLTKNSWHAILDRIYRENSDKDAVGFFMGTMPVVLIRSPALIKQVFVKSFDKAFSLGLSESKKDDVHQNILSFCADKSKWQSNRRLLSPMLTTSQINDEKFTKISNQIGKLWTHLAGTHGTGKPINLQQVSNNFFADSISNGFFGQETNSYEKQGNLLQILNLNKPSLANIVKMYTQMHFSSASMFGSLKSITKEQVDLMKNLISQQMDHPYKRHENDFIDFLISLKDGEKDSSKETSDIDVTNQMIGFGFSTIVGHATICDMPQNIFAIHLLSLHPEYQEKIRREVSAVMQKHKTSEFTYEAVQDLRFTNQVLSETARLFPTASALTRICAEDFKIPGTDYSFKKAKESL